MAGAWRSAEKVPIREGDMKRASLLAVLIAVLVSGAAYAALVTNSYVVNNVYTTKSGTKKNPRPTKAVVSWSVTSIPTGFRPNVVKKYRLQIAGVQENTNSFPVCTSSRLLSPKQGPRTCAKGSKVGSGFLVSLVGPSSNNNLTPTPLSSSCSLGVRIYNAGHHHLTLYIFSQANHGLGSCSLQKSLAVTVVLSHVGTGLQAIWTFPLVLRHSPAGDDDAVINGRINIPSQKRTVKGKTVGLLATYFCAPNHQRATSMTFTQEDGTARTATRSRFCN
jgi:hypothetical protein